MKTFVISNCKSPAKTWLTAKKIVFIKAASKPLAQVSIQKPVKL